MNNHIVQSDSRNYFNRTFNSGDTVVFDSVKINKPIQLIFSSTGNAIIAVRYTDHFGTVVNTVTKLHVPDTVSRLVIEPIAPFCIVIITYQSNSVSSCELIEGALIGNIDDNSKALSNSSSNVIVQAVGINIPNTGLPRDIWDFSASSNYPLLGNTTPVAMQVSSTSALDTGLLTIVGYTSASQSSPITQQYWLNGTAPVNIGNWLHVLSMSYSSNVGNAGTIAVTLVSSPSTVAAYMRAGVGKTYNGVYYVPSGRRLLVDKIITTGRGSSAPNGSGYFRSITGTGEFRLILPFSVRTVRGTFEYDKKMIIEGPIAMVPSMFFNSVVNAEIQVELIGMLI